jgi:hypothetical protein
LYRKGFITVSTILDDKFVGVVFADNLHLFVAGFGEALTYSKKMVDVVIEEQVPVAIVSV